MLGKKTFASRYKCRHLLYYEKFTWILQAIAREKEIKGWSRKKKIALIKTINPNLNFLEFLFPYDLGLK
jgi:putative endonuclease